MVDKSETSQQGGKIIGFAVEEVERAGVVGYRGSFLQEAHCHAVTSGARCHVE